MHDPNDSAFCPSCGHGDCSLIRYPGPDRITATVARYAAPAVTS